ncbi:Acyl-CoA synthetase short-chain family member 3, mitochondrial [Smittium mucronatum]|uniref:Acyl-CoA synthetase short-chain family member 3, mitochondrial n=1 Tax=Smittium mucronatum TaxID=133383 RepID=A0A1R0GVE9_9FUNG|nr:Acyl-CoA synthetase short-chain family member 3, mitochondrial [Smittium mucronatum]OLY80845.1 Acyl-CoA synthetase short-chain family member 3, mitochondrial [Smittium mucronatum]
MQDSISSKNKYINLKFKQGKLLEDSLDNPSKFWLEQAVQNITWFQDPKTAYTIKDPSKKHLIDWFPDGKLNVCYNALDRHVLNGRKDQVAVIYESPVTQTKQSFTYEFLLKCVIDFSKALVANGVKKGDTVIIYMPMIPQTIIAMLSCARLGAIHSVVFGGFAPAELAKRIDDCKPKVLIFATCGLERHDKIVKYKPLVDKALKIAKFSPEIKIVYQRNECIEHLDTNTGFRFWETEIANNIDNPDPTVESVDSSHPLYILYTSGTTGSPKGVVRPSGPHAVMLPWTMKYLYGINPGQVFFCASDLGWVVGHTYICYATLIYGCTSVLYEGKPIGTPDPASFFRIIEDYNVNTFFTAPTAMMVLRREDPDHSHRNKHDLSSIKGFFFAGERCVPEIHKWWINHTDGKDSVYEEQVKFLDDKAHSVDHWWQTESGSPITGICIGTSKNKNDIPPVRFGSAGMPLVGVDLRVLKSSDHHDEDQAHQDVLEEADVGEPGNIVIKLPLPPGFFSTLWHDESRFYDSYFKRFPGFYDTGDVGYIDEDGYAYIMSRDDDVINVAAHRLSTSGLEEVAIKIPQLAEVCVVPKPDPIKGSVPMVFAVLNSSLTYDLNSIKSNIALKMRSDIGPIVSLTPSNVEFVLRLPKTRSGKILRKFIRSMVASASSSVESGTPIPKECPIQTPPTIDDPLIKDEIWSIISAHFNGVPVPKSKL